MMTDWFQRYMDLAHHVAQWSKDPSTRVGAVVVGIDRREIALAYNGFPPGIADTEERLADRPTKYRFTQHAERNALDNARFDLRGSTLAVTLHPCSECAKSIVSKGVRIVLCPPIAEGSRWWQEAEWGAQIMREAGVQIVHVGGKS